MDNTNAWYKILLTQPRTFLNLILVVGIWFLYNDFKSFVFEQTSVLQEVTNEIKNVDGHIVMIDQRLTKIEDEIEEGNKILHNNKDNIKNDE